MNDRDTPKKIIVKPYFYGEVFCCPSCDKQLCYNHNHSEIIDMNYCQRCGQALDWKIPQDNVGFVEV